MDELSRMTYQETVLSGNEFAFLLTLQKKSCAPVNQPEHMTRSLILDVIAPLKEADGAYYLELFHGPKLHFKDMALSILPYLMTTAARKNNVK